MSTQPTIYSRFPRSNLIMIYFMSLNYRLSHELCSNTRDKNDGSLAYIISPSQKTKAFFFIIIRPEQKVHRPCRFTTTQYKKKVYKTDDNMNTQINNIVRYTYVRRHGKGEKIYSKTNFFALYFTRTCPFCFDDDAVNIAHQHRHGHGADHQTKISYYLSLFHKLAQQMIIIRLPVSNFVIKYIYSVL